jgi:hypothetical protein
MGLTNEPVLSIIALLLCALTFIDRPNPIGTNSEAIVIASLNPDHISRFELSRATEKTIIEREATSGKWKVVAPIVQPGDAALISQLTAVFRREILADVQVDSGNLKDYKLDAAGGIVVEIWTDGPQPAASFTVGGDFPGGSSFVRMSGDDAVYRARLGGRKRYDRRPADWRNRVVVDLVEADIQGVTIETQGGAPIHMVRQPTESETGDGPWILDPDPGWGLNPDALQNIVQSLGKTRAASILNDDFDGGFSPPKANITVVDKSGVEMVLAIGSRLVEGAAFLRVSGRTGVYAVAQASIAPLLQGSTELKDQTLFRVAAEDMARLIYYQRKIKVELAPNPATGVWSISSPAGVVADVAAIQNAVDTLSHPQSAGEAEPGSSARTGLGRPLMVFEVQKKDGSKEALIIGKPFRNEEGDTMFFMKTQNSETVYIIAEPILTALRAAFGQY